MEEIEISSWLTLDALKKEADIKETVGNLQELCYSDSASNYIRRYEDKEEWQAAIEKRMEEEGEIPYEEDQGFGENYEDEEGSDDFEL